MRIAGSWLLFVGSVETGKCRNLLNFEKALQRLKSLKHLSLIASVSIKDASFVTQLPKLKTLVVLGSSFFLNGDIDVLKQLDWISTDDKNTIV